MEWIEFLNDPELNSRSAAYGPPNGENLCKKVIHDVLECLNNYKECAKIISTLNEELSPESRLWFTKWAQSVEGWISALNALLKQSEYLPTGSSAWPNIIAQVGDVIQQASVLEIESQALDRPTTGSGMQMIQIAIHAMEKLNLLRNDIQAHEYKRLWIIRKYGASIEDGGETNAV